MRSPIVVAALAGLALGAFAGPKLSTKVEVREPSRDPEVWTAPAQTVESMVVGSCERLILSDGGVMPLWVDLPDGGSVVLQPECLREVNQRTDK